MQTLPIRLTPGQDLRQAIESAVRSQGCHAALCSRASAAWPPPVFGLRMRVSLRA